MIFSDDYLIDLLGRYGYAETLITMLCESDLNQYEAEEILSRVIYDNELDDLYVEG